jgi:hypothetical protein
MYCVEIGHSYSRRRAYSPSRARDHEGYRKLLWSLQVASAMVYAGESGPSFVCEINPCIIPVENTVD